MQRAASNLEVTVGGDLGRSDSVTTWFLHEFFRSDGDSAVCPTELLRKGWPHPTTGFASQRYQVTVPWLLHTTNGFGVPAHDPGHNAAISAISKLEWHSQNYIERIAW